MGKICYRRYNTLNCIENCIANICDSYKVEFTPLFLYSWDFCYDEREATIGERIRLHDQGLNIVDYIVLSQMYLGIDIREIPLQKVFSIDNLEEDEIYLINLDSFNCFWNEAYRKYHYSHFYLMERISNKIREVDSFSSYDVLSSDSNSHLNCIEKGYICLMQTDYESEKIRRLQCIKERLLEFLSDNYYRGIYDQIREFARDIGRVKTIDELTPQASDLINTQILRRLSYIANSRYNIILLLQKLQFNQAVIDQMNLIYEKWEIIKNYSIKMLISKKVYKITLIRDLIMDVADHEDRLVKKLVI